MLADLPTLKALMSTEHEPTIQDGSARFWKLSGSDLFILAKPIGKSWPSHDDPRLVSGDRATGPAALDGYSAKTLPGGTTMAALYWVFPGPNYFGSRPYDCGNWDYSRSDTRWIPRSHGNSPLPPNNQIALTTTDTVIASTLPPSDEVELQRRIRSGPSFLQ